MGTPRSEQERRERHGTVYLGERLPPRGTGLRRGSAAGSQNRALLLRLLATFLLFACIWFIHAIFSPRERKERAD